MLTDKYRTLLGISYRGMLKFKGYVTRLSHFQIRKKTHVRLVVFSICRYRENSPLLYLLFTVANITNKKNRFLSQIWQKLYIYRESSCYSADGCYETIRYGVMSRMMLRRRYTSRISYPILSNLWIYPHSTGSLKGTQTYVTNYKFIFKCEKNSFLWTLRKEFFWHLKMDL